ncbi:hypothetical protein ElyMa_006782700, partial [Elysia marginata]
GRSSKIKAFISSKSEWRYCKFTPFSYLFTLFIGESCDIRFGKSKEQTKQLNTATTTTSNNNNNNNNNSNNNNKNASVSVQAMFSKLLGRDVEKSNCHATVSRVSSFQVDMIGQAVFDLMGNLADGRHAPDMVQTKCVLSQPESNSPFHPLPTLILFLTHKRGLDSSLGSGSAPWPRGRGFETQPSTVQAPTGWVGVSIM